MCCLFFSCLTFFTSCDKEDDPGSDMEDEEKPGMEISDQQFTVAEDATDGDVIGEITVSNVDLANAAFTIISGNEENLFTLSSAGELSVASVFPFDFEDKDTYSLRISASDAIVTQEATITIDVKDIDEEGIIILKGKGVYALSDEGIIFDDGQDDTIESHYAYSFNMGIGDVIEGEYGYRFQNVELLLLAELFSPGTESFEFGTFEYVNKSTSTLEDIAGKKFFYESAIAFDGNNNGTVFETEEDIESDVLYFTQDGTIEVQDNGDNNYTFVYDLIMAEIVFDPEEEDLSKAEIIPNTEKRVRFSYTGTFIFDNDDAEPAEG